MLLRVDQMLKVVIESMPVIWKAFGRQGTQIHQIDRAIHIINIETRVAVMFFTAIFASETSQCCALFEKF
jgi:hypothetical protein